MLIKNANALSQKFLIWTFMPKKSGQVHKNVSNRMFLTVLLILINYRLSTFFSTLSLSIYFGQGPMFLFKSEK